MASARLTPERRAVLDLLDDGQSHKTGEIASAIRKSQAATSNLLRALREHGYLYETAYGWYASHDMRLVEPITAYMTEAGIWTPQALAGLLNAPVAVVQATLLTLARKGAVHASRDHRTYTIPRCNLAV